VDALGGLERVDTPVLDDLPQITEGKRWTAFGSRRSHAGACAAWSVSTA